MTLTELPDDGALWKCEDCYPEKYHPASQVRGVTTTDNHKVVMCLDCLREAGITK